jgi:hypothetical protein
MGAVFTKGMNELREAVSHEEVNRQRAEAIEILRYIQVANLVVMAVIGLFFLAHPTLVGLVGLGLFGYTGYEVHTVAENIKHLLKNAHAAAWNGIKCLINGKEEWEVCTENAPVIRFIAKMILENT